MLRSFVTSFLALAVTLWLLPGEQVGEGFESVAALAIGVLALGALLRPFLTRLTVLTGLVGLLLAGVLTQALILGIALSLVPSVEPFSLGQIVVASWGSAAVAAGVNWLFDASSEEAFLGQVLGQSVRLSHRQGADGPGMLVIQLDGVSEPLLRQAITAGAMPTVSRLLRGGSHQLRRWHTGLPATTPGGQSVLLHGDVTSVPSFRWYDKAKGRLVVTSKPADVAEIEREMTDGRGLLADGGASVSNLFSGDAPIRVLTMSDARMPTSQRGAATFAVAWTGLVRSIVLFLGQMLTEWHQGRRQRRRDVRPRVRRGGTFVLLRGLTTVVLRDLTVSLVAEQLARGAPVIYVDVVDYDEVAHHAGPSRPESMRTLENLDRTVQFLADLAAEVRRDYEVVIVSDHGQSQGTTFHQLTGRTLSQVVHALAAEERPDDHHEDDKPEEPWGPANVLLASAARSRTVLGTWARSAERRRARGTWAIEDDHLLVAASGSLGHVYLTDEAGRATRETIDRRYPDLVAGLASQEGVGLVLTRRADGVLLVDGPDGCCDLTDGVVRETAGADPLKAYGSRAAADLADLDDRSHVGDLVVLGSFDHSLGEVTAFEELVGSHGGLGGWQTQALLIHPTDWEPLATGELNGLQVHEAMLRQLRRLGLRPGDVRQAPDRVDVR